MLKGICQPERAQKTRGEKMSEVSYEQSIQQCLEEIKEHQTAIEKIKERIHLLAREGTYCELCGKELDNKRIGCLIYGQAGWICQECFEGN
jgi:DNA repair exonuclease SbcCD ATPase subunit